MTVLAALAVAASAPGQAIITRTDAIPDVVQLTYNGRASAITNLTTAILATPSQAAPDYTFGYAFTGPTTGRSRISVLNDLFNRNRFGTGFNVFRAFTANASGHTFSIPADSPGALGGPVILNAVYRSTGVSQRYVYFASPPSAQVAGPTANLTAIMTGSRLGPFGFAQFHVTGFFIDANGVNPVDLITPIGGMTFNTFLASGPTTFSIPTTRLTVPQSRVTVPQAQPTTTEFRAYYELRQQ
jgi:hypothetical protein